MSLTQVRSYFEGIADGLSYRKHYDGFATDNIPGTQFDRSYHVEAFSFTGAGQNMLAQDITADATVRLFFKAFRNVDDGIREATAGGEYFIDEALASENRLGAIIKNVQFSTMRVEPYAVSNDNYIVCVIEFNVFLVKGIC